MKYLVLVHQISSIPFDRNLTYVFHVQRLLSKLAKHITGINRLRLFTCSSLMIRLYNKYMKPIIQCGLLTYECTKKVFRMIYFLFRILCVLFFKNQRFVSDELFERSKIMNVSDLYVFDLMKFGVDKSRGVNCLISRP